MEKILLAKKILDKIKSGDIKIHFKSDNTIQVPAQYNAATNTIQIRFVNYMNIHQLSEELIHAVQHQQFYGNAMLTIFKDVEFEAKIFLDIARAINDEEFLPVVTMNQSNDFSGEYWKWIEKIGKNKMFMSTDEKKFRELSKLWVPPAGYPTTCDPNYTPQVLRNYFRKPTVKP
ncbi:MAG: hypothetical protein LUG96_03910 [Tannerellaceae bacterium]|nr:hypothetical protein [Tannerellaceae bacterium]